VFETNKQQSQNNTPDTKAHQIDIKLGEQQFAISKANKKSL